MDYQFVEYRTQGRLAYVTINRPAALNALNAAVISELLDFFSPSTTTPASAA